MEFTLASLIPLLTVILAVLVGVISIVIIYARWNYGFLEKLGIPVVKPHFLLGSTFLTRFKPIGYRDIDWMKEYGSVFGVYAGRDPQVYVCDPEMLRLIMVKDTPYFDAKGPVDFGDPFLNEMPDYLPNNKWKIVRGFTSPAFTGAKLRMMNFPMKVCLLEWGHELKQRIEEGRGKLVKCAFDELLFDGLTDLTLRCLFSIRDKSGRFPRILRELAKPKGLKYHNLKEIALTFPILFNLIPPTLLNPTPAQEFFEIMEKLIAARTTPNSPPDVVDICIEQLKKLSTPEYQQAKMTKETILFQAFNFFFSGQDEAALVISCLLYHVLTAPEEQGIMDKLYGEIDKLWEDLDEGSNFPSREKVLQEGDYLQACIMEVLRLYPFYDAERVCTKTWHCEKYNFTIPKGTTVMAPLWAVNRNPEYFEDPETFNPDRFLPGNKEKLHAYAWSSFGHGPRHCTGKPLAMEVIRMACAFLFKHFRFHLREDTELKFHPGGPWVFISHGAIYFDVSLRDSGLGCNQI